MVEGTQVSQHGRTLTTIEEHPNTRRSVVRKAVLYTPLAVAFTAVAGMSTYNMLTTSGAAIIGVLLFGIPALGLWYEGLAAVRDLASQPVVTRGVITRLWSKGTVLWVSRSYYVLLESQTGDGSKTKSQFFVVEHATHLQIAEGQTLEIEHWPHTHAVVRVSLAERSRPAATAAPRASRPTR